MTYMYYWLTSYTVNRKVYTLLQTIYGRDLWQPHCVFLIRASVDDGEPCKIKP